MHHIYNTDCLVLSSRQYREADKMLSLLTKDFGLIQVIAQGLRYEKSKLRYALQDYAYAEVALVRGKNDMWRLTTAVAKENIYEQVSEGARVQIAKIFNLVEKLVVGEEADETFFTLVLGGTRQFAQVDDQFAEALEVLIVYRLLHRLGYIGDTELATQFTQTYTDWSEDVLVQMKKELLGATQEVNNGLRESQLLATG